MGNIIEVLKNKRIIVFLLNKILPSSSPRLNDINHLYLFITSSIRKTVIL